MDWFKVDKEGLAKQLRRSGMAFVVRELWSNALDADEVTEVAIRLMHVGGRRFELTVSDDSPSGFQQLSDAFTLFAESVRKKDAKKRGRFGLGEKLVLAACESAVIRTTTGAVRFDAKGRHSCPALKTEKGSVFVGILRLSRHDVAEIGRQVSQYIVPPDVKATFNGMALSHRKPVARFTAHLPTEIAGDSGIIRRTARNTTVQLYDTLPGRDAAVYELGVPVVETGDKYDVDVCVGQATKILTGDLRYISARDVKPGMTLLGFDENRTGPRQHRRFRTSIVVGVNKIIRPSYRLTFNNGVIVIASAEHQWLTFRSKSIMWRPTKHIVQPTAKRPGTLVVTPLDVWYPGQSYAEGYLAAALDGEGCLHQGMRKFPTNGMYNSLTFSQNDNAMLSEVRKHLNALGISYSEMRLPKTVGIGHVGPSGRVTKRSATHVIIRFSTRREVIRFLGQCRPKRLLARMRLDLLGVIPTNRRNSMRLVRKEFIGPQRVVAITTSTRTYIAEGMASHNCQKIPLTIDRENIPPSYLREVRAQVLNVMHKKLTAGDANAAWVRDASSSKSCSPEAIKAVVTKRFGEKAVIADPSDREATSALAYQGYTVVTGSMLNGNEWDNVKKAEALKPAGQVLPTPKPFEPGGRPLKIVDPKDWSDDIKYAVAYAKNFARWTIDEEIHVIVANDRGWAFSGCYAKAGHQLTINLAHVGKSLRRVEYDEFLIHEFGHEYGEDHRGEDYHRGLCRIGAFAKCHSAKIADFSLASAV